MGRGRPVPVDRARARPGPCGLAAIAAVFPVFVSTYVGFNSSPAAGLDVVHAHGGSTWCVLRTVRLPAAMPAVIDGLRLAAPAALAGAVFGEWYGAPRGLGVLLVSAMQSARPERLWAASLLAAAMAGGVLRAAGRCCRKLDREAVRARVGAVGDAAQHAHRRAQTRRSTSSASSRSRAS